MQRIFIISPHPVFSQGVETLLSQEIAFQVVGKDADVERGIEAIKVLRPDVVIVDYEISDCNQKSVIARLLEEKIRLCVIGLNLYSNKLSIYRTDECVVNQFSDLVDVINSQLDEEIIPEEVSHRQKLVDDSKNVMPQWTIESTMEDDKDEQPN